ncbi:MAG: hypothetical protein WC765_08485 [Phycisphaerae bacterium]
MTVQQWMDGSGKPRLPYPPDGDITIGLVRFDAKGNIFRVHMGGEYFGTYDMSADRILSGGGFLDFLLQIHSKEWVSGQHLKDFLDCVTCWSYRDHGKFPQDFFDVAGGMNRSLDDPNAI